MRANRFPRFLIEMKNVFNLYINLITNAFAVSKNKSYLTFKREKRNGVNLTINENFCIWNVF